MLDERWLWGCVIWILLLVCAWFIIPHGIKTIQIGLLRRRCRIGRFIVLTYDDGPSGRLTHALLGLLHAHGATASFFVLGHKVATANEQVSQILEAGHELGSHSYRHLHAWKCDPVSIFRDTLEGVRALRTYAPTKLFRAPHGKTTLASLLHVAFLGWKQSWWTIDSTDTWESPRDVGLIIDQVRRKGGGVVLLHDMDRPDHPEREQFVLELTRNLLELAETENFRICTLGEVLKA